MNQNFFRFQICISNFTKKAPPAGIRIRLIFCIWFFILAFIISNKGFSQSEWNNWYFGSQAGVTFNSGIPQYLMDSPMSAMRSIATVSDSMGNLLFCTNGIFVYDRTQSIMPNGSGILSQDQDQAICVVQNITDASLYYIFTLNCPGWPPPLSNGGLHYSVVDMRLNGGLGDIVAGQKNISLLGNANYPISMTAARHHNNKDAWLIIRNTLSNNNFLAYLITSGGIQPPVVSSSTLNAIPIDNPGNMRVSPDGTKLMSSSELAWFEYCLFNSSTGQITPLFLVWNHMTGGDDGWAYLEFSIDSRYLYSSSADWNNAKIYQYDATLEDSALFKQSETYVGHTLHGVHLQMGPDWKIYGDESNRDSMCVINKPATGGIGCNFQANAVYLNHRACGHGLPQFLQKYYVYIHHTNQCRGDTINFTSSIWPPADSLHWDFGDPSSGPSNFSNFPQTYHIYSNPGTYTVELFVKHIDHRTDTTWQTITILASPNVALGPDRTICTGDSTTFDAGSCTGCTYVWKNLGSGLTVGTGQTFRTGQPGDYAVTVTNSNNCIGSDTIQLQTTTVPSVTNNPLSKTICSGESTNIPLTSNVSGTTFHWTASLTTGNVIGYSPDSGVVINQVLVNSLPTPGIVTYHITPKVGSCSGTKVDFPVTVNPGDSVKVSISASTNNVCAGTAVTFTATPTNGGTTPFYLWKVNGINVGTNSPNYTYNPVSGDVVSCVMTSSNTVCVSNNPATSNQVIMVIISNSIVGVTIAATQNPVCAGIPVNFTATPTNGGNSPSYQWKVNGINVGISIPSYSYTPNNGDIVECILTSNILCPTGNPATSNMITMTVNPNLPVSVLISASTNPFCQGSSVSFTAIPTNGGLSPAYQWKVNGIGVGPNNPVYSYSPNNGDIVSCVMTSNIACPVGNPATSNTITMIQNNNVLAGVSIVASTNPFCPGNSVTFTATAVNGGNNPSYQWKVNGTNAGGNSSTYSYNPMNGDSVRCVITSSLVCVSGNPASSNKIIISGTLASLVTFTICNDSITTTNAKPFKLKGGIPLGGMYSGAGVTNGIFYPAVAGVGTHQINYSYTNAALCTVTNHRSLITINPVPFTCGNPVTDIRDNKVYQTVHIGSQCWMAEDLNYGTEISSNLDQRDNCISEKYHNPGSSIQHPASVYQWDELMQYDETVSNQGLCPPGWHVPTETDWNTLFATYINNGFAASPLKYSGFSGFNAFLSGIRHLNKTWDYQGFATFFWSSTAHGATKAWAHGMNDADPSVSLYSAFRSNAFPVRCLKD